MKTCGQILREALIQLWKDSGWSKSELEERTGSSRAWINDLFEKNAKIPSTQEFDRLVGIFGKTPETVFAGFDRSGVPVKVRDLYVLLDRIVKADNDELIFLTRSYLNLMSEKAQPAKAPRTKKQKNGETPAAEKKKRAEEVG